MELILNRTYGTSRLPIAGFRFKNCTFNRTQLVFTATDRVEFTDCKFIECAWVFEGSALITLQLLSGLYKGLGIEGERLVEQIVQNIKDGQLGQIRSEPVEAAIA